MSYSACELSKELAKELKNRHWGWYIIFGGKTDKKIKQIVRCLDVAVEKFGVRNRLADHSLLHIDSFR
jgi:folylpolyglutamate synthase/dihydropteroate synthase